MTRIVTLGDSITLGMGDPLPGGGWRGWAGHLAAALPKVLTMRLPDPAQMFGLPPGLAKPLSRRMRAVNAELDRIAAYYGTVHWDASTDPETYDRRNWSVDRLHPNERGHRLIACRMWDRLSAAGFPVAERPGTEPTSITPTRREDVLWMASKGTRWVLRRSVDLIPYMVFMAAREALTEQHEWPAVTAPLSSGPARSPVVVKSPPVTSQSPAAGGGSE